MATVFECLLHVYGAPPSEESQDPVSWMNETFHQTMVQRFHTHLFYCIIFSNIYVYDSINQILHDLF